MKRVRILAPSARIFSVHCDVNWMKRYGVTGIVIGRRIMFAQPADQIDSVTLRHELQHAYQIVRDGLVRFTLKYFYYRWRYGYKDNPYEVEARQRAELPLSETEEALLWKLKEN